MAMKRSRGDVATEFESLDLAKCLIYLSHGFNAAATSKPRHGGDNSSSSAAAADVFECKTCNRKFSSFQALGGHRASHKRPKTSLGSEKLSHEDGKILGLSTKPKMHECSICGVEFALGQALGGHMRRHRAASMAAAPTAGVGRVAAAGGNKVPVLMRTSSSKRVFGLDLNLTPLENDLEYLFGKMAPKVTV
ncbi:Zinc finger protein ZAT11 [Linum grandiflorum]